METQMEWKFKENAEPQGGSDGFWYDITSGGYINPDQVLEDQGQIAILENALAIVISFEQALIDNDLSNEY